MNESNHSMRELLSAGAVPTGEEAADLAKLGRFVAGLMARHVSGGSLAGSQRVDRHVESMVDRLSVQLTTALSAATADRWTEGLGLATSHFQDMGESFWAVDYTTSPAYADLAEDGHPLVDLVDLAGHGTADAAGGHLASSPPRRSVRSLFGGRKSRSEAPAMDRSDRGGQWRDGSTIDHQTAIALESGGLGLHDQFSGSEKPTPAAGISLDGLWIDGRTPALMHALQWVEAAFGSGDSANRGLLGGVRRLRELLAFSSSGQPDTQAPRAVHGLYDSAVGTFLDLAPSGGADQGASPGARRFQVPVSQPGAPAVATSPAVRRPPQVPAPATSLDLVVPPSAGPPFVRPLVSGVFPSTADTAAAAPSLLLASSVTYDVAGRPRLGADTVALQTSAALGAAMGLEAWSGPRAHTDAMGEPLPIATAADAPQAMPGSRFPLFGAVGAEAFSTVASRPGSWMSAATGPEGSGVLDDVSWVALMADGTPVPTDPSVLASLQSGRALRPVPGPQAAQLVQRAAADWHGSAAGGGPAPFDPSSSSPPGPVAGLPAAARARTALRRPVLTAREVLTTAPWLAEMDGLARARGPEPHMPPLTHQLALKLERDPRTGATRTVTEEVGTGWLSRSRWDAAASQDVRRELLGAGWSKSELELLALGPLEGGAHTVGEMPGSGPDSAPAADWSRASALVKNLARVLTHTTALAPPRGEATSPGASDMSVRVPASTARYFEGMGPQRAEIGHPGVRLESAIGELVALARAAVAAEGPVSPQTMSSLEARLSTLGSLPGAASRASMPGAASRASIPSSSPWDPAATEQALVGLDPLPEAPGLSDRLTSAMGAASRGPAGAGRLAPSLARAAAHAAQHAADRENAPAELASRLALAPEAMLSGLRSPALRRRLHAPGDAHALGRGELPGELTRLPDGGSGPRREAGPGTRSSRLEAAIEAAATMDGRDVAALLHRVAQGPLGSGQATGDRYGHLAGFNASWLGRVDGHRTGLDLGMGDSRVELEQVFGVDHRTRFSSLASDSPVVDASMVRTDGEQHRTDAGPSSRRRRPGRRPGQLREPGRGRAAHAQRSESALPPGAPWRFVMPGGAPRSPDADLGRIADGAMGAAPRDQAAMPLIAPAVQAVAQSALRSARSEQSPGERVRAEEKHGAPAAAGEETGPERTEAGQLTREAFEQLALQMADRIARRMQRDRERRGQWT